MPSTAMSGRVVGDRFPEFLVPGARIGAQLAERLQQLLRLGDVAHLQVKLAKILIGAAVYPVESERRLVVLERRVGVAQLAIAVAEQVVCVGARLVGRDRLPEIFDRGLVVAGVGRLLARDIVDRDELRFRR